MKYEKLEVSANPFYEPAIGREEAKKLFLPPKSPETVNKLITNENNNVPTANPGPSPNINTNASTHSFTPAAVKNENANAAPIPQNNAVFSFAVLGDTQGFEKNDSRGSLQKAVNNISKANVDLVMTVGDLVSSCDNDECPGKFRDWKNILSPVLAKIKAVQGNHDRSERESSDKIWQEAFEMPSNGPDGFSELVYSFDYENSHFVVLDSEKPAEHLINKEQRDWLEKDLSANTKENTFVFFHEPAYPVSSKINESLDVNEKERDDLWNILKSHGVTAVFSGHEHIMSRKSIDGIHQFIIGNTDAFDHDAPKVGMAEYSYKGHHYAIVAVDGKKVVIKVFNVDGKELNSFVLP